MEKSEVAASYVTSASACKVLAVSEPVIILLFALPPIVTPDIPVRFDPSPYSVSK